MLTRQLVGIVVNCSPREIVNRQIGAISKGDHSKIQKGPLTLKSDGKGPVPGFTNEQIPAN